MDLSSVYQQLMANEAALLTADIRRDATMLDSLIADDFLEFGASGAAFGKSEVMERLPTEESPVIQAQDFQARQLGEGVVQITYKSVRDPASSAPRHALRSSIWRCRDGRWQMVFHQGTVTEPFAVG